MAQANKTNKSGCGSVFAVGFLLLLVFIAIIGIISTLSSKETSSLGPTPRAPIPSNTIISPLTCSTSDVAKLRDYYTSRTMDVGDIAKSAKDNGITQAVVNRANTLAQAVLDYRVPPCAASAHDYFETYVTMMAVGLTKEFEGDRAAAIYAMEKSDAAFDNFMNAIEKLP